MRQARVARSVFLPGALFRKRAFALPPVLPNPTCATWGAPKERRRRRAEKRLSKTRTWTALISPLLLGFSDI